jgi:hypothetical protein
MDLLCIITLVELVYIVFKLVIIFKLVYIVFKLVIVDQCGMKQVLQTTSLTLRHSSLFCLN